MVMTTLLPLSSLPVPLKPPLLRVTEPVGRIGPVEVAGTPGGWMTAIVTVTDCDGVIEPGLGDTITLGV
jgi:hypothetical protein